MARSRRFSTELWDDVQTDTDVDMDVDGSSTAVVFQIPVVTNQRILVEELLFTFHSTAMDLSGAEIFGFGAVGAGALTNGLNIQHRLGPTVFTLTPTKITQMVGFYQYFESDNITNKVDGVAAGTDFLRCRMVFDPPIELQHKANKLAAAARERLTVTVADNLSSLTYFRCTARGRETISA
jgi:hypothetical protein